MIKTLKNLLKQDKERYSVPRKVQDVIPIQRIWKDGIFQVGNRFSKTYKFSDINYLVASREDKEAMFLAYSELLNSLDSGATTKITINNRRLNKANFEQSILMPMRGDSRDVYRKEYNQMLIDKATGANGIMQEKYITISVAKKDIEEARTYFSRVGADLISHFAALGSKCTELDADEKLRVLHDFYRQGEEAAFHFDPQDMMKKGHDFKDYICPDSMEKNSDYLKLGEKYCRVLFLKDYASYIPDGKRKVDYNIMFIPVEGAFRLMLEEAPLLWQTAKDNNVLIVSQMTLVIVLNMIQMSWKQAEQEANIKQVYKTASELMGQLQGWMSAFVAVGDNLDRTVKSYAESRSKLSDSQQSVIRKIAKLESLGISPRRSRGKVRISSRKSGPESVIPKELGSERETSVESHLT